MAAVERQEDLTLERPWDNHVATECSVAHCGRMSAEERQALFRFLRNALPLWRWM